jgi:hypothetical protein
MKYPTNWNNPRRTPQVRRLTAGSVLCALLAVTVGLMPATTFAACYVDANGNTVCTPRQPVRNVFRAVTPNRVFSAPRMERSVLRTYSVAPSVSYGSSGPAAAYQSGGSAGGTVYQSGGSAGGYASVQRSAVSVQPSVTTGATSNDCPCGPDCSCCDDLRAENAKLKAELAELRGELASSKAASAPVGAMFGPDAMTTKRLDITRVPQSHPGIDYYFAHRIGKTKVIAHATVDTDEDRFVWLEVNELDRKQGYGTEFRDAIVKMHGKPLAPVPGFEPLGESESTAKPAPNGWRKVGRVDLTPKGWRIVPRSPVLVATR